LITASIAQAPWFVVPADDKKNTRLIVSQIVLPRLRKKTTSMLIAAP
jgi:polyphosphate kinase 2 (PPK2 family)